MKAVPGKGSTGGWRLWGGRRASQASALSSHRTPSAGITTTCILLISRLMSYTVASLLARAPAPATMASEPFSPSSMIASTVASTCAASPNQHAFTSRTHARRAQRRVHPTTRHSQRPQRQSWLVLTLPCDARLAMYIEDTSPIIHHFSSHLVAARAKEGLHVVMLPIWEHAEELLDGLLVRCALQLAQRVAVITRLQREQGGV